MVRAWCEDLDSSESARGWLALATVSVWVGWGRAEVVDQRLRDVGSRGCEVEGHEGYFVKMRCARKRRTRTGEILTRLNGGSPGYARGSDGTVLANMR